MIVSSGFRGVSPSWGSFSRKAMRGYRGLNFNGYSASFGEEAPTWVFDESGNVTVEQPSGQTSSTDWGAVATGVGTAVGGIATALGKVFAPTSGNPSTQPYGAGGGSQPRPASSSSISPTTILLGGALLVGVVMLSKK